jgi:hypothetical protein
MSIAVALALIYHTGGKRVRPVIIETLEASVWARFREELIK